MKTTTIVVLYLVIFTSCTRPVINTSNSKADIPNKSKNYYGNTNQYTYQNSEPVEEATSIKPGTAQEDHSNPLINNVSISDTSEKIVDPSLIEKYRKARNNLVYIDLYPVDWEAINKDRGIKKPKEKKQRTRRSNYFSNGGFRPGFAGIGIWPMIGFGWNRNTGWTPNIGINAGPRNGFGPNSFLGWNSYNGLNYGIGMGNTFGNPFYNNGFYNNGYYNNGYYNNNYYRNNRQQRAQNNYNQGFMDALNFTNTHSNSNPPAKDNNKVDSTSTKSTGIGQVDSSSTLQNNNFGYSDGVGGAERYRRNVKTIDSYKIK